ncbi:S-adenosyl-L-methionine-dependent methyltransferase [Apiospora arundinis]
MSMSGSNIRDLLRQTSARAFDGDDNVRLATIREAQRLVHRLQHPTERGWELAFENWAVLGALQTFIDLGIFERWHAAGGGQMSLEELCGLTKSDVDPKLLAGFNLGTIISNTTDWIIFSRFLQETSYRNPVDMGNTSFQAGCPENTEFWARCSTKPELQASFSEMMENWTRYKTHWTEYFDSRILLSCELDPSAPILVDVGGNRGHDLSLFLERHRADVPAGSLLLQDRPEALALAEVDQDKIRIMPHDFLTPQPVLGARAYMFHAVFHDWSDEMSLVILKHTATAMKRGYSRLLIVDVVLPPHRCQRFPGGHGRVHDGAPLFQRADAGNVGRVVVERWVQDFEDLERP